MHSVLLCARYVLKSFLNHIQNDLPALKNGKTLIAVSGGRDSMVLWHLFESLNLPYAIAHCNFGLRGKESNAETALVKSRAMELGCEFYVKKFSSSDYEEKLSVQENARKLRYDFFRHLRIKIGFTRVATAHHFQDQWEHLFIYLLRNNNSTGLRGMPSNVTDTYRPMLTLSSSAIDAYVKEHTISFLHDSSNDETKYLRNKIRHWIMPFLPEELLESLNEVNSDQSKILDFLEIGFKKQCLFWAPEHWVLDANNINPRNPYLIQAIKSTGLHHSQHEEVLSLITSGGIIKTPGGFFAYCNGMLVYSKAIEPIEKFSIQKSDLPLTCQFGPYKIHMELSSDTSIQKSKMQYHSSEINWPIELRKAKKGERMELFGKGKEQKISDTFINAKFPFFLREFAPVISDKSTVLSLVDLKRSNAYPLESKADECLTISFERSKFLEVLTSKKT